MEPDRLNDTLDELAVLTSNLRSQGAKLEIVSGWGNLPCRYGEDVATTLCTSTLADRDTRNLLLGLLGKCTYWDEDASVAVADYIAVNGQDYPWLGAAFAATLVREGQAVPLVTTSLAEFTGAVLAEFQGQELDLYFVACAEHLQQAARWRFSVENIQEGGFFEACKDAFPRLLLASGLSFSGFDGTYATLRDEVLRHLAALNDRFLEAYVAERGNSSAVSSRIGISVSIEGNTRNSERLMRQRDVTYDGRIHRCEWHSKIEPHRNRIHFCVGDESIDGRILIGIFTDHLDT